MSCRADERTVEGLFVCVEARTKAGCGDLRFLETWVGRREEELLVYGKEEARSIRRV